jgi:hypothetical protein
MKKGIQFNNFTYDNPFKCVINGNLREPLEVIIRDASGKQLYKYTKPNEPEQTWTIYFRLTTGIGGTTPMHIENIQNGTSVSQNLSIDRIDGVRIRKDIYQNYTGGHPTTLEYEYFAQQLLLNNGYDGEYSLFTVSQIERYFSGEGLENPSEPNVSNYSGKWFAGSIELSVDNIDKTILYQSGLITKDTDVYVSLSGNLRLVND